MPKSETLHTKYEGFAVTKDSEARQILDEKYARFQRAGATLVRLETDWDDTFGKGTWPVVRTAISPKAASIQQNLYSMYKAGLNNGLLKYGQSLRWQGVALDTLIGERIEPILEAASENEGGVRNGGKELFEYTREKGIPFIVKSASTRQVVQAAASAAGIKPDVIIATRLITDGATPYEGTITGWAEDTMTHAHNKGHVTSNKLRAIEQSHPHVIGIGDGPFDRMMTHPRHDTLWVRANGGYVQHSEEWEGYLAESFAQLHVFDEEIPEHYTTYPPYDLVSIEPDLVATNGLIRQLF